MRIKQMTDEEKRLAEEKLPKWAQRELGTLRMRLREARDENERITNGYKGDDAVVFLRPFAENPYPIAKVRETVRFVLNDGHTYPPHIDVAVEADGKSLVIYGSSRLTIQPDASNHITMSVVSR